MSISEYTEEVLKRIDKDKLIKNTLELANIDSPTGKEKDVGFKYKEILEEVGLKVTLQEVEKDRYNVVGYLNGNSKNGFSLMFNGHLDTSFSHFDPWEVLSAISPYYRREPPYAYVKDDNIYGLGVYNMKSALAAYAEVARVLNEVGVKLKGDLTIAGVVGEIEKTQIDEYQSSTYRGYGYGSEYLVQHGVISDYAVIGEPTGLLLVREHFGTIWIKFTIKSQKLSHSAYSRIEDNIIVKMADLINMLKEFIYEYQNKFQYKNVKPPVNIGALEAGWKWRLSRTPLKASLYLDFRIPPLSNPADILRYIKGFVKDAEDKLGLNIEMQPYLSAPWVHTDDEILINSLSEAYKYETGEDIRETIVTWSSDADILTRYGIKTVLFGPAGDPDSTKEVRGVQNINRLLITTKVYALTALKICMKEKS